MLKLEVANFHVFLPSLQEENKFYYGIGYNEENLSHIVEKVHNSKTRKVTYNAYMLPEVNEEEGSSICTPWMKKPVCGKPLGYCHAYKPKWL
jgi:hypothetical protein